MEQQRRRGPVLRPALLHFQALLGDVQVQGPAAPERLGGNVADPLRWTSADAVRRRADRDLPGEGVQVLQIFVGGALDEPPLARVGRHAESASRVGHAQQHDAQPGLARRAGDGEIQLVGIGVWFSRRIAVQVMELADGRDPRPRHFQETESGDRVEILRGKPLRRCVHRLAPAPEIVPRMTAVLGAPADGALEGMAVRGDEAGQQSAPGQGNDLGALRRFADCCHRSVLHDQRGARVDMAAGKEEIGFQGAHGRRDVASSAEKSHIGAGTLPGALL